MVSLFDMLRLTGIFTGVRYTFSLGSIASIDLWVSSFIAGATGVAVAWGMTMFTRKLARAKSEALLAFAYSATFFAISVSGAVAGASCYRLFRWA